MEKSTPDEHSRHELDELLGRAIAPGAGSAAVLLASVNGELVVQRALGVTRAWDAPGVATESPSLPVCVDTPFDLASVTKAFVSTALLTELDARGLDPSLPLSDYLPEFRLGALSQLTLAHLLTHSAGFPASWLDHDADPGAARFRRTARPIAAPGSVHRYSCLSLIWAGLLAVELSEKPLDQLVAEHVLEPLGLQHTGFCPSPKEWPRIAATEFEPQRGMVQGEVHDETAFALGGVSGNAGIFGPAPDLLRFAESLRTGAGLSPRVHAWLTEPAPNVPAAESGYRPSYGLRIGERWCAAAPGRTVSHTGFTGTGFFAVPGGEWTFVLLTNRVHPTREQGLLPELRAPIVAATIELAGRHVTHGEPDPGENLVTTTQK